MSSKKQPGFALTELIGYGANATFDGTVDGCVPEP